jgi:dihydropteroate synthase
MNWRCGHHRFDLAQRGLIMGVLNVTPDSFSDGGRYSSVEMAVARGCQMVEEGADILDIGGESTRPGAMDVSADEEAARVLPVIAALRERSSVCLSVDTMKASVAAAAVAAGASIINDVSGLFADEGMARVAAETGAGLVVMHMQGRPRTMQEAPRYDDVIAEVRGSLEASVARALAAGCALETIVCDPGIGFGKTVEHNLAILRELPRFQIESRPLLIGVSRKSFIGKILGDPALERRAWPTVALTAYARGHGAHVFRVHDVLENSQALRMAEAILRGSVATEAD